MKKKIIKIKNNSKTSLSWGQIISGTNSVVLPTKMMNAGQIQKMYGAYYQPGSQSWTYSSTTSPASDCCNEEINLYKGKKYCSLCNKEQEFEAQELDWRVYNEQMQGIDPGFTLSTSTAQGDGTALYSTTHPITNNAKPIRPPKKLPRNHF